MYRKIFMLIFILVIVFIIPVVASSSGNWTEQKSTTLHKNETTNISNFTVEAAEFYEKEFSGDKHHYVYLRMIDDDTLLNHSILEDGDDLIFDGNKSKDLKVHINDLDIEVDEWTEEFNTAKTSIDLYTRDGNITTINKTNPEMNISMNLNNDTIDVNDDESPSLIRLIFNLNNTGDTEVREVNYNVEANGLSLLDGNLKDGVEDISVNNTSDDYEIEFDVPELWDDRVYNITVSASAKTNDSINVTAEETKHVTVKNSMDAEITKSATKDVFLDENIHVTVELSNNGNNDFENVRIKNKFANDFETVGDVNKIKRTSLMSDDSKTIFEYELKPTKIGEFKLPKAVAYITSNGSEYKLSSDTNTVNVKGPDISLKKILPKDVVKNGSKFKVILNIKNEGNTSADVDINDYILNQSSFVNGTKSFDGKIDKNSTKNISYYMIINDTGDFRLPAANGTIKSFDSYNDNVSSGKPIVTVKNESMSDTNNSTNINKSDTNGATPGFESYTLVLLLGVVYLYKKKG